MSKNPAAIRIMKLSRIQIDIKKKRSINTLTEFQSFIYVWRALYNTAVGRPVVRERSFAGPQKNANVVRFIFRIGIPTAARRDVYKLCK